MSSLLRRSNWAAVGGLLLSATLLVTPLHAQRPDKFTNLKVLPKDISKEGLTQVMRDFSSALGVRCGFCHVRKDPSPQSEFDWASDSKPEKETGRVMMRMTRLINVDEIPKITTKDPDRVEVKCATCHHGQERPWLIEDVLTSAFKAGGMDSLKARYTELHKQYYGSATYDFGEQMLPALAERLGGTDKPDVAVQIAQFNLQLFPDSGYAHLALGQALAAAGQKDAATQELNKAAELKPELKQNVQWILSHMQGK
jgi:tetratricopeptide (TPR) repeat protein